MSLKSSTTWFALVAALSCVAELPPMPPGYTENKDQWLYELEFPLFSTQSPKGNDLDPLATIPVSTKRMTSFSAVPPGRLSLSIYAMEIPSTPVADIRYQNPTKAIDVVIGTPDHKLVWTGNSFTSGQASNGVTIYCEKVVVLSWTQETNQISEVYWSTDLKNWYSLQNVQYTGQWAFSAADCMTYGRFYRLLVQQP